MQQRFWKHKKMFQRRVVLLTAANRYLGCQQHYHVEVVPSTHDALINISYSFCRAATMEDEGGERGNTNQKKNFVVTELSIQQCLAEFSNLEFCKNALRQNRIWKYKDLYSYGKPIE